MKERNEGNFNRKSEQRVNRSVMDTSGGLDPTVETAYWRETYTSRPYYKQGDSFDDYEPAYRYGWEGYSTSDGRSFEEMETDLEDDWDRAKGKSRLTWERAKEATRDAWQRMSDAVERATPGDSDHDGR